MFSVLCCLAVPRVFAGRRLAVGSASASTPRADVAVVTTSRRAGSAGSEPSGTHTHAVAAPSRRLHATTRRRAQARENRADLCYSLRLRQKKWHDWRAYVAKEKQLKKKLAKEEKERLKRAKENAKQQGFTRS